MQNILIKKDYIYFSCLYLLIFITVSLYVFTYILLFPFSIYQISRRQFSRYAYFSSFCKVYRVVWDEIKFRFTTFTIRATGTT